VKLPGEFGVGPFSPRVRSTLSLRMASMENECDLPLLLDIRDISCGCIERTAVLSRKTSSSAFSSCRVGTQNDLFAASDVGSAAVPENMFVLGTAGVGRGSGLVLILRKNGRSGSERPSEKIGGGGLKTRVAVVGGCKSSSPSLTERL